jgi:hypothetical protein
MTIADQPTLDQALALARRLPPHDQAQLIARLAEVLAGGVSPGDEPPASFGLPVITGGTWVDDLPLNRKDLYGDDERC